MKVYRLIVFILVFVLVLSACNLPSARATEQVNPNAVFTAAAETVVVQLTKNALLNPINPPVTLAPTTDVPPLVVTEALTLPASGPTQTIGPLLPTNTTVPSAPTAACDLAQFVADVSIPDGTPFNASTSFTKTWRLKNIGTCAWSTSYSLIYDSGDKMGGPASQTLTGSTPPGSTLEVSVNLQSPASDGTYRGYWGLVSASGTRIPVVGGSNQKSFYVEIKVGTGVGTGTETPGKFAVTGVGFSVSHSGACSSPTGKFVVNATISTNKAGTVTYTWIRSDGATGDANSGTLVFDGAGSQVIPFEWSTTALGVWVELYIDKPNHQQFGRANLICS